MAFLWSNKHEFYQGLGFHLTGRQWNLLLKREYSKAFLDAAEGQGVNDETIGFSQREKGEKFQKQSFKLNQQYPLGIVRSFEEHQAYISSHSVQVFSAWQGDMLQAYFLVGKGKDLQDYIHEWAGEPQVLFYLAGKVLEILSFDLHLLSPQFMPEENQWPYQLDAMGVSMTAEYMALTKILNLEKINALVKSYLVSKKLPSDYFRLSRLDGGRFQIQWKEEVYGDLDEEKVLRFLFGPELPEKNELRALFPMRLWYWGMDSV
jgi:hypothetical protein